MCVFYQFIGIWVFIGYTYFMGEFWGVFFQTNIQRKLATYFLRSGIWEYMNLHRTHLYLLLRAKYVSLPLPTKSSFSLMHFLYVFTVAIPIQSDSPICFSVLPLVIKSHTSRSR